MRENIPLLIAKKVMIFRVSVWLLSLAVFCMARLAPVFHSLAFTLSASGDLYNDLILR